MSDVSLPREPFPRVPDDWFVGFHQGLAARFWRAAGATMAATDAELVGELLELPPGGSVLDVPCGDGRLTIPFAAAGHAATGIDIAPEEITRAQAAAADAGVDARFVVGDLRALPDVGIVDGVVSWGNSFGYLPPADTPASLRGMRRALRPGGRLVLETRTVAESLLVGGLSDDASHEFGGVRMTGVNHYRAEESRLESDYVFSAGDGVVERGSVAHHVHTTGEVVRMLREAGFADVDLRGADGREPFEVGAPRLVVVAVA